MADSISEPMAISEWSSISEPVSVGKSMTGQSISISQWGGSKETGVAQHRGGVGIGGGVLGEWCIS